MPGSRSRTTSDLRSGFSYIWPGLAMVTDCATLSALASGVGLDFVDQLGEGVEVGHADHLADLGVGVAAGAAGREGAEEARRRRAPAHVGLLGVTLLQRHLLVERTSVSVSTTSAVLLFRLTPPATAPTAPRTCRPSAADVLAAGLGVLVDDVGHQHVVGGLHLALADIGPPRSLPAGARARSVCAAASPLPRSTSVKHFDSETKTLMSASGDSRSYGLPPLVLGLDHGQRADLLVADRNLRLLLGGHRCGRPTSRRRSAPRTAVPEGWCWTS